MSCICDHYLQDCYCDNDEKILCSSNWNHNSAWLDDQLLAMKISGKSLTMGSSAVGTDHGKFENARTGTDFCVPKLI